MKSLVDALQKENMKHGIGKAGVKAGKKDNPKANAKNPAAKGAANSRMMKLIGAC